MSVFQNFLSRNRLQQSPEPSPNQVSQPDAAAEDDGIDFNEVQAAAEQLISQQNSTGAQGVDQPAVALAPVVENPMIEVGVVVNAGDPRLSQIIGGTLGRFNDEGAFVIDRDYKSLAYLFTLLGSKSLPIAMDEESGLSRRAIPASLYPSIKATLINASSINWATMYKVLGNRAMQGLAGVAMQAEMEQTRDNAQAYLRDSGLNKYLVPVTINTELNIYEDQSAQQSEVCSHGYLNIKTLQVSPLTEVFEYEDESQGQEGQGDGVLCLASGVNKVCIDGQMTVYASTPEAAREVARHSGEIAISTGASLQTLLTLRAGQVQTVEVVGELTPHRDEDGFDDDDEGGSYARDH